MFEEEFRIIFARRLAEIMEANDITIKALAERIYVDESTISGYLKGRRMADWNIFIKIAKELNVSSSYLLGETDAWQRNDSKLHTSETAAVQQNNPYITSDNKYLRELRKYAERLSLEEQRSLLELAKHMAGET